MFERWVEESLLSLLQEKGVGSIAFSPLAGGQLTDRYLNGIPADSRAASTSRFLNPGPDHPTKTGKSSSAERTGRATGTRAVSDGARVGSPREDKVTSVLIGASKPAQIEDAVGMLANRHFTPEECAEIDAILSRLKIKTHLLTKSALTCDLRSCGDETGLYCPSNITLNRPATARS